MIGNTLRKQTNTNINNTATTAKTKTETSKAKPQPPKMTTKPSNYQNRNLYYQRLPETTEKETPPTTSKLALPNTRK